MDFGSEIDIYKKLTILKNNFLSSDNSEITLDNFFLRIIKTEKFCPNTNNSISSYNTKVSTLKITNYVRIFPSLNENLNKFIGFYKSNENLPNKILKINKIKFICLKEIDSNYKNINNYKITCRKLECLNFFVSEYEILNNLNELRLNEKEKDTMQNDEEKKNFNDITNISINSQDKNLNFTLIDKK